ncbi:hypothetical protein [Agilicoccus flavus]|uniref:hypothetical protein n=1 Tax=Agilicoccus flavus TaxID=2775968 RepID=UPI001CF6DFDC|nr:hypothetical protein [Agilicoccus flavus]
MCGLCGEIRFDGGTADVGAVAAMTEAMTPREPDSCGSFARGRVALGHLSIIDLSTRGGQPMVDADLGLVLASTGASTTTST